MSKIKVVHIMGIVPAYEEYSNKPRPEINWDTPDGNWVGIWGYDWADLMGNAVLKYSDNIEYEVWQPDYRADKIYEHTFENGLKHILFPAYKCYFYYGLKKIYDFYSDEIIKKIISIQDKVVVLVSSVFTVFYKDLLKYCKKHFVVGYHYLNNELLLRPKFTLLFWKYIHRTIRYNHLKNLIKNFNYLHLVHKDYSDIIEEQTGVKNLKIYPFIDISEFSAKITRDEAKNLLGLKDDVKHILVSQRLVPEYQLDKLHYVASRLKSNNFKILITSHGEREYEKYLLELRNKYKLNEKVEFLGYVTNEKLLNLYVASDLFLTTPLMCAGSTGAAKAMAMEIPIMHTDTGSTYEILRDEKCGVIIPKYQYDVWVKELDDFLSGKEIKVLKGDYIKNIFSEARLSTQWINFLAKISK